MISNQHYQSEPPSAAGHFFEGPEKRLDVIFSASRTLDGLRSFGPDRWQEVLNFAKCTIISHKQNENFDAYVLSESSLFVFPNRVMFKTCGCTTLLRVIPKLLEFSSSLGLIPETVVYSRKNFLRPHRQEHPHTDFSTEVDLLQGHFEGAGQAYTFGPCTAEHWFLYLADLTNITRPDSPAPVSAQQQPLTTLEIMMHNLNRESCSRFFGKRENRELPEVEKLIPGSDLDHYHFEPCGYSMNGLYENSFSTIHVTPEADFSYASYETSLVLPSYRSLISAVFDLFKPAIATVTISQHYPDSDRIRENFNFPDYLIKNSTTTQFEGSHIVSVWNFRSVDPLANAANNLPHRHRWDSNQ